jgi:hypothetical protein
MPALEGNNNYIGAGGPSEGAGLAVMSFKKAINPDLRSTIDLSTLRFGLQLVRVPDVELHKLCL